MPRSATFPGHIACCLFLPGCIVIPVGDLLKGPALEEQVLVRGDGFFSTDKIAIIEIDGVITGGDSMGLLGSQENTVSELKARLVRVRIDGEVRGVVLRISSPGGEVTATDMIHHEILEFKKANKIPVVAAILDEGASGGYYIACAADQVLAQPTSIVGSIGVLLMTFNVAGLFQKIGVETEAIKSAEKKDLLSPFRNRTPEEKEILQKLVNDMYQRFVTVVSERTGGPTREDVMKLADGRIFSGKEAKEVKLVDRVGYLADAIDLVKERAKIDRKPTIIRYTRLARSGSNIYTLAGAARERRGVELVLSAEALPRAKLFYLWQP